MTAVTPPVYLDHHATTPVDPVVLVVMLPFFSERYGNPSSRQHAFGQSAHEAVETARAQVASLIAARPDDIIFTSGATEADNLALRGIVAARPDRGRHVVTTAIEHAAILEPCAALEKDGVLVTRIPVGSDGIVRVEDVAGALRADTVLVSVMAANNEIGTIQPVAAIGALCREREIPFHCDAVQAAGRIPVDVDAWNVDLMSLSAHKMYGPKGVGALYVRRARRPRLRLVPQLSGGGQERGLRSGTLNVPGIAGFGAAALRAEEALAAGEGPRLAALRDRLLAGLSERVGGLEVNGAREPRLPGNLHVSIDRVEAETLILAVGPRVALSSGAACAEAGGKGSHVLRAIGLSDERVYTSVRFGFGRQNSGAEIDLVTDVLAEAIEAARRRGQALPR